MMTSDLHITDRQLLALLEADEGSEEVRHLVAHVERCRNCQLRMSALAGPNSVDEKARELLSWQKHSSWARSQEEARATGDVGFDFLEAPSHPEMLGRLGRFEVENLIGSGGMGVVFKAFDSDLNRPVAIKVLAGHLAESGAARRRFAREAKAAAAVVDEHIVAIHGVEADRDSPFFVMQYVAGESLQSRVDREGPLSVKEILRIGIQTAAGLAAAHDQGVIHRDVKPANILLEHGVERAMLSDFGLARTIDDESLTRTGIVAGTPHYMSPEQANGRATDSRSDLFSLGSVLYFMAAGHPPFQAENAMGVLHRVCHERHRPLWQLDADIPDELCIVIDRLLDKRPAHRFASAGALRDRLTSLLAGIQQPQSLRRRLRRYTYRHPQHMLFAVGLALAACALVLWPDSKDPDMGRHGADELHWAAAGRAAVSPVIDFQESIDFDADINELHSRLERIADASAFPAEDIGRAE